MFSMTKRRGMARLRSASHAPRSLSRLAPVFPVFSRERDECDMAGLFDCRGHDALVFGACTRLAARTDLAVFGDIAPEQVHLFVVNCQGLICAELTIFRLCKEAAFAACLCCLGCSSFVR